MSWKQHSTNAQFYTVLAEIYFWSGKKGTLLNIETSVDAAELTQGLDFPCSHFSWCC